MVSALRRDWCQWDADLAEGLLRSARELLSRARIGQLAPRSSRLSDSKGVYSP